MQGDTDRAGIDLFDFLYEAWLVKWVVAAIILVAVAIGGLAAIARDDQQPAVRRTLIFPFYVDAASDPMQRKPDELLLDIVTRVFRDRLDSVIQIGTSELNFLDRERYKGKIISYFMYKSAKHGDVVIFPGDNIFELRDYYERLNNESYNQVSDTRKSMERNIEVANEVSRQISDKNDEYVSRQNFIAKIFIRTMDEDPDGVRFVTFSQPVAGSSGQFSPAPMSYQHYLKPLVIWLLVGGVVAVFFVMFRIGIRRKRARSASNPA